MKKHYFMVPVLGLALLAGSCGPSEKEQQETQTEAEEKVDAIIQDLEKSSRDEQSVNAVPDTLPADTAGAQNKTYTESHLDGDNIQ